MSIIRMNDDYWNAGFNLHQLLFDHVVKILYLSLCKFERSLKIHCDFTQLLIDCLSSLIYLIFCMFQIIQVWERSDLSDHKEVYMNACDE